MNQRSALSTAVMTVLGLVSVASSAAAQGTLKQQLVGTWTFVSVELTLGNGSKRLPAGPTPKGVFVFDDGGRFIFAVERPDRPKYKLANRPTSDETFGAMQDWFSANFGTWSVSEPDKTLVLKYDGALRPNNEGTEEKSSISLAGDKLELSGMNALDTGARPYFLLMRAK